MLKKRRNTSKTNILSDSEYAHMRCDITGGRYYVRPLFMVYPYGLLTLGGAIRLATYGGVICIRRGMYKESQ